jgi:hypothetical protein
MANVITIWFAIALVGLESENFAAKKLAWEDIANHFPAAPAVASRNTAERR